MSAAKWERLANEAIADAREWKRRAYAAENLLREIRPAVSTAYFVIGKHRLAGMDQNPLGFADLLGSADAKLEAWSKS